MMKKLAYTLTCCITAVVITGCASSPLPRFYMLSSTAAPVPLLQADYSISVGPVSMPAAVDRPQIVVRTGPNQVSINEFDRWASPLKNDVGRVVVENLAALLGAKQVTLFPQSTAAGASYRVMIDVLRFDSELDKAATLDAFWTVISAKNGHSYRDRTTLTEVTQGDDYNALAAAHSRALGRLSAQIAGTIREIEAQKH